MKNKTRKYSARKILQVHWRGVKEFHRIAPKFFLSQSCKAAFEAVTPYVTIFFSSRIINELAGLRRPEALKYWVILALAVEAGLALTRYGIARWADPIHSLAAYQEDTVPYLKKLFSMDYADVDSQATKEMLNKIRLNESYVGLGFPTIRSMNELLGAFIGILSAITLTISLFTSKVPQESPLAVLNQPLFFVMILALVVGTALLSGYLSGKCWSMQVRLNEEGTQGNNIFGHFMSLGSQRPASVDVRLYEQQEIAAHYFETASTFRHGGGYETKVIKPGSWYDAFGAALSAALTGFIYLFTCLKAWGGAFGVGLVTQYVGAVTALSRNISNLLTSWGQLEGNVEAMELIFEFLDIPNSMYQGSLTTEKRSDRQYEVEFKDVSFRYPNTEAWVLRHVNIRFQVGQRLAVVGENGSGKTTFINLLCRLYDPTEGQILLNGIDIRKYDYRDYMNIFSVVFQDFQLIAQPLGNNVAGAMDYDRSKVEKALRDAGFGDRLAEMPKGLDSYLYKDLDKEGVEVSGGEVQKIAIARALYKDAPFIILDEPTAALDPLAEAEIYSKFDQIAGDRTAVYISHRLSSCKFCDEIAVFDHGQVVQQGGHEELLSNESGKYHELWHAQAQYYAQKEAEG